MPDMPPPLPAATPDLPAHRHGPFRRAIVPISLTLATAALLGWGMWTAFGPQREDVATARTFLTHIAAAQHTQAEQYMSPTLMQRLGPNGLSRVFGQIEPWDHIGFFSRETNGFGDVRSTELYGTGEAVSGCESTLRITLINGQVDAFNVTPLCSVLGTEA